MPKIPNSRSGGARIWPFAALVCAALLAVAEPAAAQGSPAKSPDGLLFSLSFDNGLTAEHAGGVAEPLFAADAVVVPDGAQGPGLAVGGKATLAWEAPGNIYAQRGLVAFAWRSREPLTSTPFPIFRVGYPDHTSWDMVFLRIDWNGAGFDAFVTDTNLARTRVSFKMATRPDARAWTHLAFGWDERTGVQLWVDGKPAARADRSAVYDSALFGFGPFQRIVSGLSVHSADNFIRGGDIDELRIYDRRLGDAEVAKVAANEPVSAASAPRPLTDPGVSAVWASRFGWDAPTPYLADPQTRIRKVEFTDTRDLKQKMFRGADGLRETTWPGVYNRSRLPGRADYFLLPDWNVYSQGGQTYRLTLPDEPWNRVEITGAAYGSLDFKAGDRSERLATRRQGALRTVHPFNAERRGGELTFTNVAQETPIQEIAAYNVTPGAAPVGSDSFVYTIRANAAASYPTLSALNGYIAGRYVEDERSTVVALPAGAPMDRRAASTAPSLPLVHVLIPAEFRDTARGQNRSRFSYGWRNIDGGLDGVAIDLPAMKIDGAPDGLAPINIRIKDPTWPDRDLMDINVAVKPGEARSLWLDTRDRILPPDTSLYLTLASDRPGFNAAALEGTTIRLVFKPADQASAEHLADRSEQARDNFAFNVEERPGTRLYPTWARFETDITDVLRVDPGNPLARAWWVESNPHQAYAPLPPLKAPPGAPLWAFLQTENLKLYRQFITWWIDERQVENGEFGGGLSDDTDLVNMWVPLALMGDEPERLIASQRRLLDATYANGMWTNGLSRILGDELHSYEEGVNSVAQSMLIDWGNPTAIERAMEVARAYPRLAERNAAGHVHLVSSYYSGSEIVRDGVWGWQKPFSLLITHPGLLLVDYNGAPQVRQMVLDLAEGWLAHGKRGANGVWTYPSEIEWATDRETGAGVANANHFFWTAWRWTGDEKYLRPLVGDMPRAGLSALNADVIARLGKNDSWGRALAASAAPSGGKFINTTAGETEFPSFVRWQETGDISILERIYATELESSRQRLPIVTEGHLWSDRVALPIDTVQRARMGGVAHRRNAYAPGHVVSWRFDAPRAAESVGILIPHGDPKRFKVTLHNLSAAQIRASMVGAEIEPGQWSVVLLADDGAPVASTRRLVNFERGVPIDFDLPPGQTVTYALALETAGAPTADRPDVGISRGDLKRTGDRLTVKVHSLGARPTPGGRVVVEDAAGKVLAVSAFRSLAAPVDLWPKTREVSLRLPPNGSGKGWRVSVRLEGETAEITQRNNTVALD